MAVVPSTTRSLLLRRYRGPQRLQASSKERVVEGTTAIIKETARLLMAGQIVAIKGIGGFHLACDAHNDAAVARLRARKHRDGKPFAVMCADAGAAHVYAHISAREEALLRSAARPVVLLLQKAPLAGEVTHGLGTIGIMLPYAPVHHLLFDALATDCLVMTSGNFSDEPIVIDNKEALSRLGSIADAVLFYNRDIVNRSDDSVVFSAGERQRIIRRSRGFAPAPIQCTLDMDSLCAAGGELKNCFAAGKGTKAIFGQHIGDLKTLDAYEFYEAAFERLLRMFRIEPETIACDMHPDYWSTRYAESTGLSVVRVQHHHAHIGSCMAEHGLDEPVIGVSMDGTGLGDDDTIWGGEFFICDLIQYERKAHLAPVALPGGDLAAKEPWRMALSCFWQAFGADADCGDFAFCKSRAPDEIALVRAAFAKKINMPLTSSAGRLFDAAAALSGICFVNSFDAEAPIRLEALADPHCRELYPVTVGESIDTMDIIRGIVHDARANIQAPIIAAKFHNGIVAIIVETAKRLREQSGVRKAVLSGGVFQNRRILEGAEQALAREGFIVFSQHAAPANDGGIALGQLAVAAKRRACACV